MEIQKRVKKKKKTTTILVSLEMIYFKKLIGWNKEVRLERATAASEAWTPEKCDVIYWTVTMDADLLPRNKPSPLRRVTKGWIHPLPSEERDALEGILKMERVEVKETARLKWLLLNNMNNARLLRTTDTKFRTEQFPCVILSRWVDAVVDETVTHTPPFPLLLH